MVDGGELFERVYDELRVLARQRMANERADHSLQATALVHEAYLRLGSDGFENRAHFFHAAARAMRQILVEHARARGRIKRGGELQRVTLDLSLLAARSDPGELLALDEAISKLEQEDESAATVVRLRFFGRAERGRNGRRHRGFPAIRAAGVGLRTRLALSRTR